MSHFITRDKHNNWQIYANVTGIHCASCVNIIETTLKKQDSVVSARVAMSSGRLALSWQGSKDEANRLLALLEKIGYGVSPYDPDEQEDSQEREAKFLFRCMGISGFAMSNLMLLSIGLWSSSMEEMGEAMRAFLHFVSAIIALPTLIYAGRPFYESAWSALKKRRTNMDVPISLALILTGAISLHETFIFGEHSYFDSAVMLLFFLLIGRYLDKKARGKARMLARKLLKMLGGEATRIDENGTHRIINYDDIKPGMILRIASGEKVAADGVILSGETQIDTSVITGESMLRDMQADDQIFAGMINIGAPITMRVDKAGDGSLLADIVKLMEKAEQSRSKYVLLADRAASLYTPVVHILGLAAFLMWLLVLGAGWQQSLLYGVTVLIITCPCALGLAVPVVQIIATSILLKNGIMIKSGDALERMAEIDTVIFDKTGTLTIGKPQLQMISRNNQADNNYMVKSNDSLDGELLENINIAYQLAKHSNHLLAKGFCSWVDSNDGEVAAQNSKQDADSYDLIDINEIPGYGVEATINGKKARFGRSSWACEIMPSQYQAKNANEHNADMMTTSFTLENSNNIVDFYFSDELRSDAIDIVDSFRNKNIDVTLLSGDRHNIVAQTAQQLQISDYHAELSPKDKIEFIEKLKENSNRKILMVGDGINDAPALAAAYASLSPTSAADIAQNSADIVFQGDKLAPIALAHQVACKSKKLVKENFMLSLIYNIIAVPFAFAGYITPFIAAIAMSSSSLVVIANSFRLHLINNNTNKKQTK